MSETYTYFARSEAQEHADKFGGTITERDGAYTVTEPTAPNAGDVILRFQSAPTIPSLAEVRGAELANKSGMAIELVDALTGEVWKTIQPDPNAKRTRGNGQLTDQQQIFYDLCYNTDGATVEDFAKRGVPKDICHWHLVGVLAKKLGKFPAKGMPRNVMREYADKKTGSVKSKMVWADTYKIVDDDPMAGMAE